MRKLNSKKYGVVEIPLQATAGILRHTFYKYIVFNELKGLCLTVFTEDSKYFHRKLGLDQVIRPKQFPLLIVTAKI